MKKTKKISASMEDYLEAIAQLKKENGVARVRDLSKKLNVKAPSVTSALNTLLRQELIIHERYGYIDLTSEGRKLAENIQKKHDVLVKFLSEILDIDYETAKADACRIEHAISPETFKKLTKFIEFVEHCPQDEGPDWLQNLYHYFETSKYRDCCFSKQ